MVTMFGLHLCAYTYCCGCPACGLASREIGQDINEVLDYERGSFHLVRHLRPKLACSGCKDIKQAAAPSRPIDRVMPSAGTPAHVLVSKYCDHTPLYRQSQIYARVGLEVRNSPTEDLLDAFTRGPAACGFSDERWHRPRGQSGRKAGSRRG